MNSFVHSLPMLLGPFKIVVRCVLDPPNVVYFLRIQHGCDNIFRESEQDKVLYMFVMLTIYIFSELDCVVKSRVYETGWESKFCV